MTHVRFKPAILGACVMLALSARDAQTDEPEAVPMPSGHLLLKTGDATLRAPDGRLITIPLGSHVYDAPTWALLDDTVRDLQEDQVRLTAENKSLRQSTQDMADSWSPGWKILLGAVLVGASGGWYLHSRL